MIKITKNLFVFLLFLGTYCSFAVELNVDVVPKNPSRGEPYTIYFRISSEDESDFNLKFDSENIEIQNKINQGVTTRSTYINGNFSRTREVTYAYEVVSEKEGPAKLDHIKVLSQSKEYSFDDFKLTIGKELQLDEKQFFAVAAVDKTDVYLGEGILVRYYVYAQNQISQPEIKKFSNLDGFLKRYINTREEVDRVSVNGQPYNRYLLYMAKVFPEKTGELTIDSMSFNIRYQSGRDNYGGFGFSFGLGSFKSKSLISKPVIVQVHPLPPGAPKNFTGLIGEHQFKLNLNKSKFLANEPIELTLQVKGPGMLENLSAPTLINHSDLEKFDASADLDIAQGLDATKTFKYTYLGRNNLEIPAHKIPLSYFDHASKSYKTVEVPFPGITVAGGRFAGQSGGSSATKDLGTNTSGEDRKDVNVATDQGIQWGSFLWDLRKLQSPLLKWLNFILGGVLLLLGILFIVKKFKSLKNNEEADLSKFKKGMFSYGDLYEFLDGIGDNNRSLRENIWSSPISEKSKKYFDQVVNMLDKKYYATNKVSSEYKYYSKAYKEVLKLK